MPELLLEAIQLKNWYAIAALSLTLLLQIFRKAPFTRDLWAKIPTGWHFMVPLLSGAITAFTEAFAGGAPLSAALTAAVMGALGIGLGAMGLNAALTDSKIPWNGGAGGVPKDTRYRDTLPPPPPPPSGLSGGGLGLGFAAACALIVISCGGSQPQPRLDALTPLVCRGALTGHFSPADAERICSDSALATRLATELTEVVVKAATEAARASAAAGAPAAVTVSVAPDAGAGGAGGSGGAS